MKNRTQQAADQIRQAILHLKSAKQHLLAARSDQHVSLAMQLAGLEEIYSVLTDPECTPEIMQRRIVESGT